MSTSIFLAQAASPSPAKSDSLNKTITVQPAPPAPMLWSPFRSELGARTDLVLIFGAVVAIGAVLFGWALFFRRPSSRTLAGRGGVLHEGGSSGSRRRRRSRKSPDAPRNPTLKERGGLPPNRSANEAGEPGTA